ncbi:glutamate ABC transporter substrate-binding protein [Streptomyces sp. NPDC004610]|uniref:glutamate ABC transporter substrate-binding protein n=1 Tax=unclassified Streptomyces TaxID=2593676 RepID=UPI0033B1F589
MMDRRIPVIGAGLLLTVSLTACGGAAAGGDTGQGGTVVIGIKYDQPGVGLKEGDSYTGFDVEVARYVAEELGYTTVEFREAASAQRETMLQSDQVKLVLGAYSITEDRAKKISFAGPYFVGGQDLLVRTDTTDITGPESLQGKKLCSVTGSVSAKSIKDNYSTGVQLQEYDTYSKCVEALNTGSVDAVTTDNTILAGYATQPQYEGRLKLVGNTFTEERYGVGIKKGDTALCAEVNKALANMIADGSWKKAFDDTQGRSGVELDPAVNPPKTATCS